MAAVNVRDNVIATRFDLTEKGYKLITRSYLPDLQQAAALIDLPDENFGSVDLYVICAHFKAGVDMGDILLRIRQGDAIAAHIGDAVTPGGEFDFPGGTPIIVLGDFNIYSTDPRDTKCYGVGNGAVRRQPRRGSYRRA